MTESENEEQESTGDPELDRQVESLEGEGDRVGQEIDDAKRDWEGKQEDPGVPGAVPPRTRRRTTNRVPAMADETAGTTQGDGYAVATIDGLGEGPGFRKVRRELEVEEFGVNAIVLPAGYETGFHFHERQEELYFVHSGTVEIEFGDGTVHRLGPGGLARVAAATHRKITQRGRRGGGLRVRRRAGRLRGPRRADARGRAAGAGQQLGGRSGTQPLVRALTAEVCSPRAGVPGG